MRRLIVVSSVVANKPLNGGNAAMVWHWLEGLSRLGADVFFVEQIKGEHCVDAAGNAVEVATSVNRAYFEHVLGGSPNWRAALVADAGATLDGAAIYGATAAELEDAAGDADLLINISGHLSIDALKQRFRRRAYVDLDPGYTQLWHAQRPGAARLGGHDVFFSVGQNIGTSACDIPTHGLDWHPLRQPIVLDACRVEAPRGDERFTTVGSWRGAFGPLQHRGRTYGAKVHEFRKLVDLPRRARGPFEVALDIHPADAADLNALIAGGWQVVDARGATPTPAAYNGYIEGSAAECSAAQGMYVQSASGWFSDRTARYLASGKPALIQDTGFVTPSRTQTGIVPFTTLAEAIAGADRIARDYDEHSQAARSIAERYFDSDTELARLLEHAGAA